MEELRASLRRFANAQLPLGAAGEKSEAKLPEQPEGGPLKEFRADLAQCRETSASYTRLLAGMIATVFVASVVLLVLYREQPAAMAAIFGASGVSIAWSIRRMERIIKSKTMTDTFLVLIGRCPEKTLQTAALAVLQGVLSDGKED